VPLRFTSQFVTSPLSIPSAAHRPPPALLRGLRVCLLAGTLGQGGAEQQLYHIATTLKAAGAHPLVLSLTIGEFWETRLRDAGIAVQFVGQSPCRLKRTLTIIRATRAFQPHLIQAQHFYVNLYAALAAKTTGAPCIGAVRGNGLAELDSCGRILGKLSLHLPQRLAVNSHAAMQNLLAAGCPARKLRHLPNVIDSTRFERRRHQNGAVPMIVGVGRLGPEKRFDFFLNVLGRWRQSTGRPFRSALVGDGPLRAELENLARTLGLLEGSFQFRGKVADVAPIYQEADLLMLTSAHEGSPNVIMEAMASGLPVVAAGVGEVPRLVCDQISGFVLRGDDLLGFMNAIERLSTQPNLRKSMGNAGRAFIRSNHDLVRLPGLLNELYADVLTRSNPLLTYGRKMKQSLGSIRKSREEELEVGGRPFPKSACDGQ